MTYTNLLADVASWTARGDLTTANIETFIELTEAKISRLVRTPEMRTSATQAAYAKPKSPYVVFKLDREVLEPVTLRAKDSTGGTLRVYDSVRHSAFEEIRLSGSNQAVFTVDPISSIPATHYDGSTYSGKASVDIEDTRTFTICVAFKFNELGTNNDIFLLSDASLGNEYLRLRVDSSGQVILLTRNTSTTIQVDHTFTDFTVTVGTWHRLILSYTNVSGGTIQAYLDDTASGDSPTFNNTSAVGLNGQLLRIGCGYDGDTQTNQNFCRMELCQLALSTVRVDVSTAAARARFFTAGATGTPVQYGTSRGREVFGQNAEIWMPDGDRNYGTEESIELLSGRPTPYDTYDDFGPVSDLFGVMVNPGIDDSAEFLELEFIQELPALSSTVDTNWLIANHYDLYFYGCMGEAYDFLQDSNREAEYRGKFAGVIDAINLTAQRKLRGTGPHKRRNPGRVTP